MKKRLNPNDWLPKPDHQAAMPPATAPVSLQVEYAIQALEAQQKDITASYPDWVRLCYALIEGTGAESRDFFHRISRFHPEYDAQECDRQYDRCHKSAGSGITIASFFHHVKEAGVQWRVPAGGQQVQNGGSFGGRNAATSFGAGGIGNGNAAAGQEAWDGHSAFGNRQAGPMGSNSGFEQQEPSGASNGFDQQWPNGQDADLQELMQEEGPFEKEQDLVEAMLTYRKDFPITDQKALPVFPEEVYGQLPNFLKDVLRQMHEPTERDALLLGSLTALSAALPNIFGFYYGQKLYPTIFSFVTAPAASGKGRLAFAKHLVKVVDRELREKGLQLKQEYEAALAEFNADKKNSQEKPQRPPKKMLILPGNSSASGMIQLLGENNERGLLFETESDTLANSFRSEYGDFSDSLRKAFHHETISLLRRTENEHINLEEPVFAVLLAGTPRQIKNLIRNVENGLFSRFAFYYLNRKPEWADVFDPTLEGGLDDYYLALGEQFARFHKSLEARQPLRITLSADQRERFHYFWTGLSFKYQQLQPGEFMASVRRMGVISFRLMMILSSLRVMEEGSKESTWTCREADFESALLLAEVLLRHASHVFYGMPMEPELLLRSDRAERLLERLPLQFGREQAMAVATEMGLSRSTLTRELALLLKMGLIKKPMHNKYEKNEAMEEEE